VQSLDFDNYKDSAITELLNSDTMALYGMRKTPMKSLALVFCLLFATIGLSAQSSPDLPRAMQIPSEVMKGLVIHKVPPAYPESAKQNNIQGTVVLRAVIGKDGRIADLRPISGPAELIPATISAVKQWEYRPYVVSGKPTEVDTQITVNFTLSH
jgi:TonB family protein